MTEDQGIQPDNRVHVVHRLGAAIVGLGLWVFAAVGLLMGQPFFSTQGRIVFGLASNGALSVLSLVAGAVLLGAALWGGPVASTMTAIVGGLFLLSGFGHLAILHTPWNILAFQVSNVLFSLVVGVILLVLGLYGRVSGGLPPDNPYRQRHPIRHHRPSPEEQRLGALDPHEQALLEAEMAMGDGVATPEQERMVRRDLARRQIEERRRAYRRRPHGQMS